MTWRKKWGKDKICPITMTRLRPGKNREGISYTVKLKCKHTFYRKALVNWVNNCPKQVPTCPSCRKSFDPIAVLVL